MPDTIDDSFITNMDNTRECPDGEHDGRKKLSGSLLVAAITSVCSSGFLLFGYDQGITRRCQYPQSVSQLIKYPRRHVRGRRITLLACPNGPSQYHHGQHYYRLI